MLNPPAAGRQAKQFMKISAEQLPHKIAFTGAGGVGKTKLIEAIEEQCESPSIGIVAEAARVYFRNNPTIPVAQRYDFEHQEKIQRMAMGLEEMALDPDLDYLFTDRSVFDAPVCVASAGDEKGAEILLGRAWLWVPGNSEISYSQIYVLDPSDVPFKRDAERTEGEATRQRQHEMFLEFFSSHGINHKLLSGTLDERTEKVLAELPQVLSESGFLKTE